MSKIFYRVSHEDSFQGLWYDFNGGFTGLIHDRFSFLANHDLKMDYDPELAGYISATATIDELFVWFPRQDILALQPHGFYIHQYEATDFKWYERFSHWVINQQSSRLIGAQPIHTLLESATPC